MLNRHRGRLGADLSDSTAMTVLLARFVRMDVVFPYSIFSPSFTRRSDGDIISKIEEHSSNVTVKASEGMGFLLFMICYQSSGEDL